MNVGQPALFSNVQVWGKSTVKCPNSGVVLVAIVIRLAGDTEIINMTDNEEVLLLAEE